LLILRWEEQAGAVCEGRRGARHMALMGNREDKLLTNRSIEFGKKTINKMMTETSCSLDRNLLLGRARLPGLDKMSSDYYIKFFIFSGTINRSEE
jgi:hypothetical protein